MKPTASRQAARELDSITASFTKVRILRYASEAPATAAAFAERLGQHSVPSRPDQLHASLARQGLLRAKANLAGPARQYSLTPKGRRLLAVATKHLRQLAASQFTNRKQ